MRCLTRKTEPGNPLVSCLTLAASVVWFLAGRVTILRPCLYAQRLLGVLWDVWEVPFLSFVCQWPQGRFKGILRNARLEAWLQSAGTLGDTGRHNPGLLLAPALSRSRER